jgi:hypothetical protein
LQRHIPARTEAGAHAAIVLALPVRSAGAADKAFPTTVAVPAGFAPEGITTGRGTTAYSSSIPTGAVYKSKKGPASLQALVPIPREG